MPQLQSPIITDFTAGELSEKILGRVDLPIYYHGVAEMENFFTMVQGGAMKRPGTLYLGSTKSSAKAQLIPYIVSNSIAYVVEITNAIVRFWRDGAMKLEHATAGVYLTADIGEVQYTQYGGDLYLVQQDHPPQVISYTGTDAFSMGAVSFTKNAGETFGTTSTNYPGVIGSFGGRLYYGATLNQPQTVWVTKPFLPGNIVTFETFTYTREQLVAATSWGDSEVPETETVVETRDVTTAANGMELTMTSGTGDDIEWICPSRDLIIGTTRAEHYMPYGMTAINPSVRPSTTHGSASVQAQLMGGAVIYARGDQVGEYIWNRDRDSFESPSLTHFSDHILGGSPAVQMAYMHGANPMAFFVRSDGDLAVLTYDRTAGVTAWARWSFDGLVESVAVIPESNTDVLYLTLNRSGTRYMLTLHPLFPATLSASRYFDMSYDVTADRDTLVVSTTLTAPWLASRTVSFFVDGVYGGDLVANGSGELELSGHSGTQVDIGVKYNSDIKLLPVSAQSASGQGNMAVKQISHVLMRLYRTRHVHVGYTGYADTNATTFTPTFDEYTGATVATTTWFTGDVEFEFPGDYDRLGYVYIRSDEPVPTGILAISPKVSM